MNIVFKNSTEKELLNGLLNNNTKAFEEVYKRYYFMIEKYITNNNGNKEDARDVFQDVLIALIKSIHSPNFELNKGVKLSTYIHAIARNIWHTKLRANKKIPISNDGLENLNSVDISNLDEINRYERKHVLMAKIFREIKEDCKKLLESYYFKKIPLKEAAKLFGYSLGFVRVKKNRCMNDFRKRVIENQEYINLQND